MDAILFTGDERNERLLISPASNMVNSLMTNCLERIKRVLTGKIGKTWIWTNTTPSNSQNLLHDLSYLVYIVNFLQESS